MMMMGGIISLIQDLCIYGGGLQDLVRDWAFPKVKLNGENMIQHMGSQWDQIT